VILTLDDNTGRMEVVFFEDGFAKFKHVAQKDRILVVEGGFSYDEFNRAWRINKVKDMYDLDALRQRRLARLEITLDKERLSPEFNKALKAALRPDQQGRVAVRIQVRSHEQGLTLLTPIPNLEGWRIQPSEALMRSLDSLLQPGELSLVYGPRSTAPTPERAYA
jgi:DNA polymerase III alpha subunit